jgi:hypothetical protein
LLRGTASSEDYASLSPSNLSGPQWREYADIIGGPIQNQVKSAAKQLRASRTKLRVSKGGLIFLNTGYKSLPHSLFDAIVRRYCDKDTRQVDFVICISSWLLTNGFDSAVFFALDPRVRGSRTVRKVRDSFWKEIAILMDIWARSGFAQTAEFLEAVEPIAFRSGEMNFSTPPENLPGSLDSEWNL